MKRSKRERIAATLTTTNTVEGKLLRRQILAKKHDLNLKRKLYTRQYVTIQQLRQATAKSQCRTLHPNRAAKLEEHMAATTATGSLSTGMQILDGNKPEE